MVENTNFQLRFADGTKPQEKDRILVSQFNAFMQAKFGDDYKWRIIENAHDRFWRTQGSQGFSLTVRELVRGLTESVGTTIEHIEGIRLSPLRNIPRASGELRSAGGIIIPSEATFRLGM